MTAADLKLVRPDRAHLPGFLAALTAGWSPNTSRDTSGEHLDKLAALGEDGLLAELNAAEGTVMLQGRTVPKLPGCLLWMSDGAFSGTINFRYLPGTEDLPAYCSGHIGYSVIPEKRRRGYATAALGLILDHARAAGLARVSVTANLDNVASRRTIEAQGGVFSGEVAGETDGGMPKALYWITL